MKRTITKLEMRNLDFYIAQLYVTVLSESPKTKNEFTHRIELVPIAHRNDRVNLKNDTNFLITNPELRPQVYEFIAKEFGYNGWYSFDEVTTLEVINKNRKVD